jgi:predicted P-loop ATPase
MSASTQQVDIGASQDARAGIDWRAFLIRRKGKPLGVLTNVITALAHADEWHGLLSFNEFTGEVITLRKTPWGKDVGSIWTDIDDSRTAAWLQRQEEILASTRTVAKAVQVVARDRSFHPLREKIEKLKWDGVLRLDTWPIVYLGAHDTPYVRAVGARWMISLPARLFAPGCKADHVLMLEGGQGKKKSTALSLLVGDEYFTDRLSDLGSKDCMLEMAGRWLIELGEIQNYLHGRALERFKAFITSRTDYFREPYARRPVAHKRHCVLAATTNSTKPFIDPTGTRRIWPIRCGVIRLDLLKDDADQLLSEAYVRFRSGDQWYLETDELEALATEEQDERYEPGVWDDVIIDWLENPIQRRTLEWIEDSNGQRKPVEVPVEPWYGSESGRVTTTDILVHAVGKDKDRLTPADAKLVVRCLEHMKWRDKQDRSRGPYRGKVFYYSPERWMKEFGQA